MRWRTARRSRRSPAPWCSAHAHAVRGIALELERLANHVGDLGALAGDIAYLPTASYCGRLRGDFLNMTAELCGSRFGRGLVRPGGVGFELSPAQVTSLRSRLIAARTDVTEAVELLWETPSVRERFEGTGTVSPDDAAALGLVGPAARACGIQRDVRHDFPAGIYRFVHLPGDDRASRRRQLPRVRPLARDPAVDRVHPEPARRLAGERDSAPRPGR